jgi:hypothetical protein
LFTLPKVYEMRKEEIDGAVLRARDAAAAQYSTARTMVRACAHAHTHMRARAYARREQHCGVCTVAYVLWRMHCGV